MARHARKPNQPAYTFSWEQDARVQNAGASLNDQTENAQTTRTVQPTQAMPTAQFEATPSQASRTAAMPTAQFEATPSQASAAYGSASAYSRSQYGSGAGSRSNTHSSHSAYPANVANASGGAYAPANAGAYAAGATSTANGKRARKRGPRALVVVLAVLLALLLIAGGCTVFLANRLDNALSGGEDMTGVADALVSKVDHSKPFYVLLLGSDSREGNGSWTEAEQGDNERSDVIILARVDAQNKLLTLVSVPRDTPYQLEDGTIVKINEMFNMYGAAGSIKAVSELTGVEISHFATVRFSDLQAIVDLLGGVEVYVDTELSYYDALSEETVTIYPGVQTLTGQQAQIFARARHEYGENQEAHRQSNVRTLLTAIMKKTLSQPVTSIPSVVLEEAKHLATDITTSDLVQMALGLGTDLDSYTMYSCSGPSNGEFVASLDGMWLCYRNPEGWAKLMAAVDAGQDPTGIDYTATQIAW